MDNEVNIIGNSDINQALEEFEIKSTTEKINKPTTKNYNIDDTPGMVKLLIKYSGGAIKEQKQAEKILLIFVIISITIALFLSFGGRNGLFKKHVKVEIGPELNQIPR
ncbi:MAG: hypothetical protein KGI58_03280 [Patescibacteria group bacterium]|nr:hypothetical protein [Patescibacteria group bacterium]